MKTERIARRVTIPILGSHRWMKLPELRKYSRSWMAASMFSAVISSPRFQMTSPLSCLLTTGLTAAERSSRSRSVSAASSMIVGCPSLAILPAMVGMIASESRPSRRPDEGVRVDWTR